MSDPTQQKILDVLLDLHHRFGKVETELLSIIGRVARVEGKVEDTGKHDLTRLESELAERRKTAQESRTWWARNWVGVVIAIGMLVLSTACSVGSSILVIKVIKP